MGWVKLDDAFFTDARSARAGLDGRSLFLSGLCYCARNLSDGHIDEEALPVIAALAGVGPDIASTLVTVGLWEACEGGWNVPRYLDYNPGRAQVEAARKADAERKRRSRSDTDRTPGRSHDRSPGVPSRPVPAPISSSPSANEDSRPQAVDDEEVVEVCRMFAERKAERATNIGDRTSWTAATRKNAMRDDGERVRRWLDEFDITTRQAADALVEGKAHPSWTRRNRDELPPFGEAS